MSAGSWLEAYGTEKICIDPSHNRGIVVVIIIIIINIIIV